MTNPDPEQARNWEPALGLPSPAPGPEEVIDRIGRLLDGQRLCVLSTQGGGRPYGSLLVFASTPDRKQLVFATPVTTRKYSLLKACEDSAALIDDRAQAQDMLEIEAVTALGRAAELDRGAPEYEAATQLYLARHPQMAWFLRAPSCALFSLAVSRYVHVARLQEVSEWRP